MIITKSTCGKFKPYPQNSAFLMIILYPWSIKKNGYFKKELLSINKETCEQLQKGKFSGGEFPITENNSGSSDLPF